MQQSVLIIGGSGYIGLELVSLLSQKGWAVTVGSRRSFRAEVFPEKTGWLQMDATSADEAAWVQALRGFHAVIFAAGADDRTLSPVPAFDFFYKNNVLPVQRLMAAAASEGVGKVAILGSYFSYFERNHPGWKLAETHAYIRSRKLQWQAAMSHAGPSLAVMVFEIPYVVGASPNVMPLWQPLVKYVNTPLPFIFYMKGGSAVISVSVLAKKIVEKLEAGESGLYPVAEENMTWRAFLSCLMKNPGRRLRIVNLPVWFVSAACRIPVLWWKIKGKEPGLHAPSFAKMQGSELFLPLTEPAEGSQVRKNLAEMTDQCMDTKI